MLFVLRCNFCSRKEHFQPLIQANKDLITIHVGEPDSFQYLSSLIQLAFAKRHLHPASTMAFLYLLQILQNNLADVKFSPWKPHGNTIKRHNSC